jgi:ppGpp synthetase/RelA/SpoT-type nucleotidyltranferase
MMKTNQGKLNRVEAFLEQERTELEAFLQTLKTEFKRFSNSSEGLGRIYRIYSRGEKQNGHEFKDKWKIAQRLSGRMPVYEVSDIIGITIVCPFKSDMKTVTRHVEGPSLSEMFSILDKRHHETEYHATHFIVGKKDYMTIRCEIQVKTAFHDAWTVKSHDLVYKPEAILDGRYASQMGILAAILEALERQADIIKEMIEENVYFDKSKKDFARRRIIIGLTESLQEPTDDDHRAALRTLQGTIMENHELYSTAPPKSPAMKALQQDIDSIGARYGFTRNLCRLAAAAVVARPTNDCLYIALNAIEKWKAAVSDTGPYPLACPYHFCALVLYACGQLERAAIDADNGIAERENRLGIDENSKKAFASALGAAAYYHADLAGSSGRMDPDIAASLHHKAQNYIARALALNPGNSPLIDTDGFIKIAFAGNEAQVEAGLDRCRQSWEALQAQGGVVAETSTLYYGIHKRLAYRKILSFGAR